MADDKRHDRDPCPFCKYPLERATARCPECGVAIDAATMARARRRAWRRRLVLSMSVHAVAIYAPYAWLLWNSEPWGAYRWLWVRMWPVLPGLFPGHMLLRSAPSWLEWTGMAAFTLLLATPFVLVGARGRRSLIVATAVAFALSVVNAWGVWQVFRA